MFILGGLFVSCAPHGVGLEEETKVTTPTKDSGSKTEETTTKKDAPATLTPPAVTPVAATTKYTLDMTAVKNLGKVEATNKKIDDTISVYASANGKSIEGKGTYVQMTGGKASKSSGSEYGLQVTLTKAAKVTIGALSKESKSAAQWVMIGATTVTSTGTPAVAHAKSDVTTTAPATLTFENVAAGTYMLGAKSNGGNLYSLVIEYK